MPFRPFIWLLSWLTNLVLRLFSLETQGEHSEVYSEDELRMLVAVSQQKGLIDKSEQELITRVFGFADVAAKEVVMVPRTEMVAIPIDADLDVVVKTVASAATALSRLWRRSRRHFGIFYAKDLYRVLSARRSIASCYGGSCVHR